MEITQFLNLLSKVKKTGKGKWMACCPAHGDKNPSMAIAESSNGTILVHCFSQGCDVDSITGAIGLTPADLFPPKDERWQKEEAGQFRIGGQPFTAYDALACLAFEGLIVATVASDIDDGLVPSPEDRERVTVAAG
ncbi:MAG: hypothetical protein JST01_29510, partial [Cyanobacteria bacterium SZAS TMP-1]|nr:hypothetical protein [Cyanobacteria bacterium SZAS TMP-1]